MQVELTRFLGRMPPLHERMKRSESLRNGSYPRNFALKGMVSCGESAPDRKGEYRTSHSKEQTVRSELRQDMR